MRIYDLIAKKRDGGVHTRAELETLINGYVAGDVPDYQMAAWMMAVYLRGMTDEETAALTDIMAHSGEMVDLSPIAGVKVDKHSTGGVGDKTTLVIAPIAAACGVKIAKMSGRGLGHTGGTIDKMESVPGTRTALSQEEFFAQVNRTGIAVIGQSENIAVADKKMYALRDVTATVSCIPLIASSIMSKKLASGSDAILLDVTTGTGAFMKTVEESIQLARLMVAIGAHHGRKVAAMITDMDTPLGHNIGNSLEVIESMEVLKGRGPADLTAVCIELAAYMLVLAGKGSPDECRALARQAIADGSAFAKCKEMFAAQGGELPRCGQKLGPLLRLLHFPPLHILHSAPVGQHPLSRRVILEPHIALHPAVAQICEIHHSVIILIVVHTEYERFHTLRKLGAQSHYQLRLLHAAVLAHKVCDIDRLARLQKQR